MSLHTLANHMAQTGRGPDSMLVHMSPREVNGLQALAKAHGGTLTTNPQTGLPEAGFLDSLLPMILGIALAPETGGASLGITSAWETAAVVGGLTGLATGSLQKGLMAGFGAYGGAGIGGSLANAGVNQIAAEELVKQNVLNPADVTGLGAPTSTATNTFIPGADGMPATAMPGVPVGPPSTAMPFDPYSTGANPYALGNAAETAAYSGAAQAPGVTPPVESGMSGIPNEESIVGNGPGQMSKADYTKLASSSMTPEQLTAAKQQMIAGIKNGTVNPFDSLGKGIQGLTDTGGWGKFAKANMVPIGMAASHALLSQPQPTTSTPTKDLGGFHTGYYDPVTHQYVNTGGYVPYKDWGDKNVRDYTHAKNGGLMSLANGGAVAFADGGGFVAGGGSDRPGDYEKMVAYKAAQDAKDKAALDSWTVSETSPMYAGYMAATDQRKNDIKSMDMENTKLAAYRQTMADMYPNSTIVSGGTLGYDPTGDQTDNYITDASGKSRYLTNQDLVARDAYTKQLLTTQGNYAAPGAPDVPAAGGTPTESARAQGIQALTPATSAPATAATATPSGIQLVHGSIYDPVTGRFRNPTEAEIGAQGIKTARDGVNTTNEMSQLYADYFKTYKAGEVLDFAGGTLTKNTDGSATHPYKDGNGKQQSYTLWPQTDIATVAKNDPAIAAEWKSMFNYTVPTATGSPIITTPGPTYPSIPTPGSGGPGTAVQNPTGWTPTPAPPTRVPTSIEDFNTRFNKQTGDSKAQYDYLMGNGPEPKQTLNTEVAAPYWEKMGMAPVNKTRSSRIYDPNLKNAAGKVVGGYVANPDFKPKVMDPVTKRMVEADPKDPTQPKVPASGPKDDPTKPPTESAGEGYYWDWNGTKWVAVQYGPGIARGGMIGYATGGLGSLGGYSDGGQLLRGDGDGVSDSIPASIGGRQPARLADGEFVVPARIVSELGNGSTEAGARRLYQMMDRVQGARRKSIGKNKVATNSRADKYLPA